MRNQYKILAEKYEQVLEAVQEPVMTSYDNGTKEWRLNNGKLHRLDGPAIESTYGTKEWWRDGKRHRLDGPAIEYGSGAKLPIEKGGFQYAWWRDGKRHRLDGPAIEWTDGTKEWWQNGKLHRLDGPAVIHADGRMAWFINGKKYSENEFNKEIWDRNPTRRNILKRASGKAGIEMDI